jgi:hypothetical protein
VIPGSILFFKIDCQEKMNYKNITSIPICAIIIFIVVSGCVAPSQKTTGTYPQNNPSNSNPSPIDVNHYAQIASESAAGKTVVVTLSPDKSGLLWQGGPDIASITSWEAKLGDGTRLVEGSSAPSVGQFDRFNENAEGEYLIVTATFSDGHQQVILTTLV